MTSLNELPVWIGGKEKVIGGLNRHTRCEDVIAILLQDRYKLSKCELSAQNLHCYALFEKWRGCERQLSPRTRMYKLWKAWGAERDNVKFTLRKSVAISKRRNSVDSEVDDESGGIKLRDKAPKPANRRQGQYNLKEGIVAFDLKKSTSKEKSKDKRRRSWADDSDVGFSDVRILCPPPLDCDSSASTSSSNGKVTADGPTTLAEEVEGKTRLPSEEEDSELLIQRILRQSHQLHSLLETIGSVDHEIEYFETRLHYLRMQEDGQNYVQDAYLSTSSRKEDAAAIADKPGKPVTKQVTFEDCPRSDDVMRVPPTPHESVQDLEEYVALCDRLFKVDDDLRHKQDAIKNLSSEIGVQKTAEQGVAEGSSRPRRYEKKRSAANHARVADIGFARAQLERSADTCVAQRKELDTLHEQIQEMEYAFNDKRERLAALTNEIEQLEQEEEQCQNGSVEDDEIRACVELSHSTPVNVRCKDSSMESSLDQGIGNDFSPIDVTNRKSPSRSCDTDSSSDTGLSSLHSQDENEPLVYNISETLV
ncbi:ras association domain-containing protein 10-like [Diadema setosum]|uniref:ras association domain-containing protein 10-like n=1 Tax=Diadema setosum TaxID=31175 RepID=UPI003B3A7B62